MMILFLALVGGVIGIAYFDGHFGGFLAGGAVGALAGWVAELNARLKKIEMHLRDAPSRAPAEPSRAPSQTSPAPQAQTSATARTQTSAAAPSRSEAGSGASAPGTSKPSRPDPIDVAVGRIKSWLTTGNVPVKVGVVLSVFGVGFLVKEAVNRHWLFIPIEWRLVLVALFGIALLVLGWRLREKHRSYALSVQGGGVAVLYLTTYASFAIYRLLPSPAAFLVLIAVTVAAGALAVLEDSRALAVLGVVGGFMAPVLTSSGAGNHVALFGYYAVLNALIVGVAWFRSWRMLNVLGFVFTFGIGSLWGYAGYRPEHFATTEPFLVLFVVMYTLIPVLFATRQAPDLKGFVDGTLLFGTPIAGFGLQTQLVGDTGYGLAISAIALAALYVSLATLLYRRRAAELRVLVEALFALGLVFLTIAVPLALDARWTSVAWALEGAAMIWLGVRQRRLLALASGAALQLAAGWVHFADDYAGYRFAASDWPVLNGPFLGAALIALAGWISGRLADRALGAAADRDRAGASAEADRASSRAQPARLAALRVAAPAFLAWGTAWWLLAGLAELARHAPGALEPAAPLLFVAATAIAAVLAAPRVGWPRLNAAGLVTLPALVLALPFALFAKPHPFADFGWIAWPAIFAAHATVLRLREEQFPRLRAALHAVAYWVLALLLALEAAWLVDRVADGIWPVAAALAASAALVLFTARASARPGWPFGAHRRTYLLAGAPVVLVVCALGTLNANLRSPGDPSPLPYVPLLNPLELASVFVVLVLLAWWRAAGAAGTAGTAGTAGAARAREAAGAERSGDAAQPAPAGPGGVLDPRLAVGAAALFGLFLVTMTVARCVHHWGGVPFDLELLVRSTPFQAALSIVWGTAALAGMLLGARAGKREVWLAGAALMAIVVAKLFLVDLGNAGTVGRVVSFLGVGLLLLVVGYFAPVPPRAGVGTKSAGAEARS